SARTHPHIIPVFFFPAPPPTALYTLSLHDALPISRLCLIQIATTEALYLIDPLALGDLESFWKEVVDPANQVIVHAGREEVRLRSEEHTFELQSPYDLVCRLLLEKKKKTTEP